MKKRNKWLPVFLLVSVLMIVSSAMAANAWISVPSALGGGDKVTITGGSLAPFSNVSVQVVLPNGTKTIQHASVTDDGKLSADYMPVAKGKYSVKVLDQNGKVIGGGDFIY